MDLEAYGAGLKGAAARGGMIASGLVHLGLAIYCVSLIYGAAIVGVCCAAQGVAAGCRREIRASESTRRLDPVLRAGLIAQGIVVGIIGGFVAWAGWTQDASEAGGIGMAFQEIRQAPSGQIMLLVVALGFVAFALCNAPRARHGVVPRAASPDTATLGGALSEISARVPHPRTH
jgi:hypothetical protein